ncbi:MAG TPA: tetratricopeptide repeat protein [Candidatus Competibacteraceae bacterium]|nr:tetratricopeptide repeat protein [Candidatus Competibacteraceae bacterium]
MSLRSVSVALCAGLLLATLTASADQRAPGLDLLFERLKASTNLLEARQVELAIWRLWLEHDDPEVNRLMRDGLVAMSERNLDQALADFTQVVALAPGFAEGWNKRATVYYLRDQLNASMRDIQRTLALEPRHFGALSGMGLIFMERGDDVAALHAYQEVLKLYPQSLAARLHIEYLQKKIRDSAI